MRTDSSTSLIGLILSLGLGLPESPLSLAVPVFPAWLLERFHQTELLRTRLDLAASFSEFRVGDEPFTVTDPRVDSVCPSSEGCFDSRMLLMKEKVPRAFLAEASISASASACFLAASFFWGSAFNRFAAMRIANVLDIFLIACFMSSSVIWIGK